MRKKDGCINGRKWKKKIILNYIFVREKNYVNAIIQIEFMAKRETFKLSILFKVKLYAM